MAPGATKGCYISLAIPTQHSSLNIYSGLLRVISYKQIKQVNYPLVALCFGKPFYLTPFPTSFLYSRCGSKMSFYPAPNPAHLAEGG